ncbi:MAG: YidC/Oxa1 family membrane protein insertase [Candidatus Blackburnbacteria bacterium]|nr:YidC/Oxa1 family membrane protein insertase [Candidatus Blackburnbacteria bacterium]
MEIWQTFFVQPLLNGLLLFYHLFFNNLGLAIIALTVAIRLVLTPLVLPSMRAMQKMKDYAPELAKLKEKHKGDKTKLMQAQADFYKSKGINPASGCLPQIAQLVVLIALFQVFSQTLYSNGDMVERVNRLAYPALTVKNQPSTGFLLLDLTKPDTFRLPGLPIPLPGLFLVAAALIQLLSSKMMTPAVKKEAAVAKKTPGEMDDIMAATQQQMLYLFPALTIFIGFSFPSGLVLYWLVFSFFQAVQQYMVSGWGGLAPWLRAAGLLKLASNEKTK